MLGLSFNLDERLESERDIQYKYQCYPVTFVPTPYGYYPRGLSVRPYPRGLSVHPLYQITYVRKQENNLPVIYCLLVTVRRRTSLRSHSTTTSHIKIYIIQ